MNKNDLQEIISEVFSSTSGNIITREIAITPELENLKIFDAPLIGIASANDKIFFSYKDASIIGPHYMTPHDWLPEAKSVIAIFFPFSESVRKPERAPGSETSGAWLHGRIEGQNFIANFTKKLSEKFSGLNVQNCAPSIDERFKMFSEIFSSNWSERHAAFAAGLGTFGLSRGIITRRGMAGRLSSIIINENISPDTREYSQPNEFCIMCGACIKRCPANAISFENGKNHLPCARRLGETKKLYAPRYGCGKCQTAVPCEFRNPKEKK